MTRVLIDTRGKRCPYPVIELGRAWHAATTTGVTEVELLADDPVAAIDIPAWCHIKGVMYARLDVDTAHPVDAAEAAAEELAGTKSDSLAGHICPMPILRFLIVFGTQSA